MSMANMKNILVDFFFFCVPSYISFTILGEIFVYFFYCLSNHSGSHILSLWIGRQVMYNHILS